MGYLYICMSCSYEQKVGMYACVLVRMGVGSQLVRLLDIHI